MRLKLIDKQREHFKDVACLYARFGSDLTQCIVEKEIPGEPLYFGKVTKIEVTNPIDADTLDETTVYRVAVVSYNPADPRGLTTEEDTSIHETYEEALDRADWLYREYHKRIEAGIL